MPTVEDGTGLAAADSYISVDYADAYHLSRGYTAWSGLSETAKQQAIVRATDHMDAVYGTRFRGAIKTTTQALAWPRYDAFDDLGRSVGLTSVPKEVQKACAEFALRAALYGILRPDPPPPGPRTSFTDGETLPDEDTAIGPVVKVKEKVGPIEQELLRAGAVGGTRAKNVPEHPIPEAILRPVLRSSARVLVRG